MSKINDLINELCPDGVEYVILEDIATLTRGKVYSKMFLSQNKGDYPVYSSQTANNGELGRISSYDYDGEFLTWTTDGAYAGTIFHRKGKFSITNVCGLISLKSKKIIIRFLYYWLSIEAPKHVYTGMGNPKLMSNQMSIISIPVPPLEIQEEIVRILDKFTDLTAELQAELQGRIQQYDFYRNRLLTYPDKNQKGETSPNDSTHNSAIAKGDVKWMRLEDVLISIKTGLNPRKFFQLNTSDASSYYVTIREFKGGQLNFSNKTDKINENARRLCNNRSNLEIGDILFSGTGTIGETYVITKDPVNWNIKEGVYSLKPKKDILNPYFLKYILSSEIIKNTYLAMAEGGTVKSVSMKNLSSLSIPIPSLEEQERIVSILDKFDTLVNDLKQGLPAEIEALQQQYEYYREKLLIFDKIA